MGRGGGRGGREGKLEAEFSGFDDIAVLQEGDSDRLPVDARAESATGVPEVGISVRAGRDFKMQGRQAVFPGQGNIARRRLTESEVPCWQVKAMTGWGEQTWH
ncbi:MAG: hypothetical protein JWQ03_3254 [Variovorax sp.]|nr:hypothetical protein [Variovorax sp.]